MGGTSFNDALAQLAELEKQDKEQACRGNPEDDYDKEQDRLLRDAGQATVSPHHQGMTFNEAMSYLAAGSEEAGS